MNFGCIVADPPWRYDDKMIGMKSTGDGVASKYNLMSPQDIRDFPFTRAGVGHEDDPGSPPNLYSQFAADAHLWLWVTNAFLEEGHRVCRSWGFEPKTMVTWVKGRLEYTTSEIEEYAHPFNDRARLVQHIGQGHYLRNSTEHCIFAVKGKAPARDHGLPTAFVYPGRWKDRLHSEKPPTVHEWAEAVSPGPYLEVFARRRRDRWLVIGDQLDPK